MVKMDLSSSNSQASSTATTTGNHIGSYQKLIASLQGFSGADGLKGSAYTSAKSYASSILVSLVQGAILLSEQIANSTAKLPSDYSAQVAPESLDSEVLESQIATYTAAYNRACEWLTQELKRDVLDGGDVIQAQKAVSRNLAKKQELEEKLRKLLAFDATSETIFSEVETLFNAVSQGMSQVKSVFNNFNGTFTIPTKADMQWLTTINKKWEKREKALKVLKHSDKLTEEDVQTLADYVGTSLEGKKTILLFDNYYGYAKYIITLNATEDGKLSLKFGPTGLDSVKGGESSVSKDGKYSTTFTNPVGNSALKGIYNFDIDTNGLSGASTGFSNDGVSTEFGMKFVNGTLATYSKSKSEISTKIKSIDMTAKVSVEHEEGIYIRNNNSPHLSPLDNFVSDVGEWMEEHPIVTTTATVIGGIIVGVAVAYFAWPIFAGSAVYAGIVELGGAIGGAIAAIWNTVSNAFA
ncbi:T7SS effector LXG polymorphic toxin [Streptococcus gordonii]|uniref:T7SS effector LXG polymorphic toxin n=1 Tax=Streptococcus gordonii TaxID=1302 RepID=UPI000697D028|nr:T7SS effector LXG polymorphic toxin [Streptococcus gordonii]AOS70553.1 hypothetical protein WH25_01285 [Streptococcus gordonii]